MSKEPLYTVYASQKDKVITLVAFICGLSGAMALVMYEDKQSFKSIYEALITFDLSNSTFLTLLFIIPVLIAAIIFHLKHISKPSPLYYFFEDKISLYNDKVSIPKEDIFRVEVLKSAILLHVKNFTKIKEQLAPFQQSILSQVNSIFPKSDTEASKDIIRLNFFDIQNDKDELAEFLRSWKNEISK